MLKKEGNLNLGIIISRFVKDYCGPNWNTSTKVLDIKDYEDGYPESNTNNKSNNEG
jgi:hypothetical protein